MKKKLIIAYLTFPILTFSQIPEKIKIKADSILTGISTKEIYDKIFQYNCIKSSTFIYHTYWYACTDLTDKQKRLFKKQSRKAKSKAYEIVYNCLLLDTIQGLVKICLDEKGKLLRLSGIPSKDNFQLLTSLAINSKNAKEIAVKYGFQKGLTQWEIYLSLDKLTGVTEKYFWIINNTLILGDEFGCKASGEILYIDASTGEISLKNHWEKECVN